ncbi:hypothetical protein AB8810_04410 [Xanthomonas sp. NCPPB 3005]|uniref:hypothetical protein n=1 Tax=Xanthomonas sp. NCPPB 3005 TaxID=3240913 RepID=UPI003511462B
MILTRESRAALGTPLQYQTPLHALFATGVGIPLSAAAAGIAAASAALPHRHRFSSTA